MSKPLVIMLIGLPGAGKTVLAKALESRLGLHRVCRDGIRAAMFPRCTFSPAEKRAANQAALRALEVNCAMGRDSVLDGRTFARLSERVEVESRVDGFGAQLIPIWMDCSLDVARSRVEAERDHPAGDRDARLVESVAAIFEAPQGCIQVDASEALDVVVEAVVASIEAQRAGA